MPTVASESHTFVDVVDRETMKMSVRPTYFLTLADVTETISDCKLFAVRTIYYDTAE